MTQKSILDDDYSLGLGVTASVAERTLVLNTMDLEGRLKGAKIRIEMPLTATAEKDLGEVMTAFFLYEYVFRSMLHNVLKDLQLPVAPPSDDIAPDDRYDGPDDTKPKPSVYPVNFRIIEGGAKG